ncbi:hypothetical protein PENTCL1PPCAC_10281, partial [Pristionchus entomophagus]
SINAAERPLTDDEEDSFERIETIDACNIPEVFPGEEEDKIRVLATDLAKARLRMKVVEDNQKMWMEEVYRVHVFYMSAIVVSIIILIGLRLLGVIPSPPTVQDCPTPPACPGCPVPDPCPGSFSSLLAPGERLDIDDGAREVSFWHQRDYNYDFKMLGGFVSEISGKSEKAGLKIGDEILEVNGVDIREYPAEIIYNLIWKIDVPSGKEESRWARHDWEKPITLLVRRNIPAFERLQVAVAKAVAKKVNERKSFTDFFATKDGGPSLSAALLIGMGFLSCCVVFGCIRGHFENKRREADRRLFNQTCVKVGKRVEKESEVSDAQETESSSSSDEDDE